jgi:hypothetical protein
MSMTLTEFYHKLGWSTPQVKALVILPKITGFLSCAGSSNIIQDVIRDPKEYAKLHIIE